MGSLAIFYFLLPLISAIILEVSSTENESLSKNFEEQSVSRFPKLWIRDKRETRKFTDSKNTEEVSETDVAYFNALQHQIRLARFKRQAFGARARARGMRFSKPPSARQRNYVLPDTEYPPSSNGARGIKHSRTATEMKGWRGERKFKQPKDADSDDEDMEDSVGTRRLRPQHEMKGWRGERKFKLPKDADTDSDDEVMEDNNWERKFKRPHDISYDEDLEVIVDN